MNRKIPFVPAELRVVDTLPGFMGGPGSPLRDTPVTPRENIAAMFFDKHPYWLPLPSESSMIIPSLYNNLLGRGGPDGTTDAFGIEWEWVASAGGSIVRPGDPFLSDANEWYDKIKIPDIDTWDWAGEAEQMKLNPRVSTQMSFVNGFWFERLISFMDFAQAAVALIDDDQKKAVQDLFAAMTDLGIKLVDKFCEYYPALDGFNIHDDWGSQKAPFFSQEVAEELFVPYMRALTDHIHSKGRYVTLHCCGHSEDRIRCFVDGGFDGWDPQTMNDTYSLFDAFGDKIAISIVPEGFPPDSSEDEQREAARAFAKRFCVPGKTAMLGHYAMASLTPAFAEEVYIQSRKRYFDYTC
ncbi:MAG: methyltransferase [Oscillospiraceae bacterium]|jgi:hypothetical protein|nr:methyltransferase [Oscillospiraceae bacterium]